MFPLQETQVNRARGRVYVRAQVELYRLVELGEGYVEPGL